MKKLLLIALLAFGCYGNEKCSDENACNYDEDCFSCTTNPSICIRLPFNDPCKVCSGETDGTGRIINLDKNGDGTCEYEFECYDPEACNFYPIDTNGELIVNCIYTDGICEICEEGEIIDNDTDDDGVCDDFVPDNICVIRFDVWGNEELDDIYCYTNISEEVCIEYAEEISSYVLDYFGNNQTCEDVCENINNFHAFKPCIQP